MSQIPLLPQQSKLDVTIGHRPPVTVLDQAYNDLLDLYIHDKIRYGDFTRAAIKHGLTKKDEVTLRRRMSRYYHRSGCHNFGGAVNRSSGAPNKQFLDKSNGREPLVDFHGKLFYRCSVSPALIQKLPFVGTNGRGWWGFRLPNLTLMCFKNGRMEAYDKGNGWRESLVVELRRFGWSDEEIGLMFDNFRVNGEELHTAERTPGVLMGVSETRLNGLEIIKTDHTPYWNGSTEHVFKLEQYFEELHHEVKNLPNALGLIMSGMPITSVLNNLMVMMDRMSERIAKLEERNLKELG